MATYRIPAFEGLNTFNAEHLLKPSEALELSNARVETGELVSVDTVATTTDQPADLLTDPTGTRSIIRYNGLRYWTDNDGVDGGSSDEGFLGIDAPVHRPTVTPIGAGDVFNGRYKYAVTFITDQGYESAPITIDRRLEYFSTVIGSRELSVGQLLSSLAPPWDPNTEYGVGSLVNHAGKLFKAKQAHDGLLSTRRPVQVRLALINLIQRGAVGAFTKHVIIAVNFVVNIGDDPGGITGVAGPFRIYQSVDITDSFTGILQRIPGARNRRAPTIIGKFTGVDVSGVIHTEQEFNYREIIYSDVAANQFTEPLNGISHAEYWEEVDDTTAAAEPEIHGASSFSIEDIPVSLQSAVTKRRVYRSIDRGDTMYLSREIPDNTSTFISDTLPDEELQLRPTLNAEDNYPPVQVEGDSVGVFDQEEAKFMVESNGTFFVAHDNRVYMSRPGNPHVYPPLNNIKYDAAITGLAAVPAGILVFTQNRTYHQLGNSVDSAFKKVVPSVQGVQDWRTINRVRNAPIWQSNDGIAMWSGNGIEIISNGRYVVDFTGVYSVVENDAYYLVGADKTMVIDFRNGARFYERTDITSTKYPNATYDLFNDKLYFVDEHGGFFLDGQGSAETFTYTTPEIDAEDLTQVKRWQAVWITSTADVSVEVFFEGVSKGTIALTGTGRKRTWLPPGLVGHTIKFKITGVGTLKEVSCAFTPLRKIA